MRAFSGAWATSSALFVGYRLPGKKVVVIVPPYPGCQTRVLLQPVLPLPLEQIVQLPGGFPFGRCRLGRALSHQEQSDRDDGKMHR